MTDTKNKNNISREDNEKSNISNVETTGIEIQTGQQTDGNSLAQSRRNFKKIKIAAIIFVALLATILCFFLLEKSTDTSSNTDNQQISFPPDTDYPEEITDSEKKTVTDEVVAALNRKYGTEASFEVLEMKKGEYELGDVPGRRTYFDIGLRIVSSEINADFSVDYQRMTDNLWTKIQNLYVDEVTSGIQEVDSQFISVSYNLSDYSGFAGDNKHDYESLSTVYGRVPTKVDLEQLVQTLEIYSSQQESVGTEIEDVRKFIDLKKRNINTLYRYISDTYPRIPEGIGVTSVTIDYGNEVAVQLLPLSKTIRIAVQGSYNSGVNYDWADIIESSM